MKPEACCLIKGDRHIGIQSVLQPWRQRGRDPSLQDWGHSKSLRMPQCSKIEHKDNITVPTALCSGGDRAQEAWG